MEMCNYKYEYKKHHLAGISCIYPDFYVENASEFPETKVLPIDNDGYCIFHSRNKDWKIENRFAEKFAELLQATEEICRKKGVPKWAFNFSGFYFFHGDGPSKINNCKIPHSLDFTFCEFVNGLTIENAQIKSIDIDNSQFHEPLLITNANFSANVNSTYSTFDNGIAILNSELKGYNFFNHCTFKNQKKNFTSGFSFKNCRSDYVNFEKSNFEARAVFETMIFNGEVIFDRCAFLDEFFFHDAEVNGAISFKEAHFLLQKNANPMYSSVDFAKLKINKNGRLIFKGKEPLENMVDGELQISFETEPEGIISFENFNLNKIYTLAKLRLFELEKIGRVEIGKGCRKYYCQTDIFEIAATKPDQKLILDMVKVFCNYFDIHNHYNLGLEIVERGPDLIKYFFFTDEIISKQEFERRIKQNEYDLWETFANLSGSAGEKLAPNLVQEKNILIDLAGIFLKIRTRILALDYSEKQLCKVIDSIAIDGKSLIEPGNFYHSVQAAFKSFDMERPTIDKIQKPIQITMKKTININAPIGNAQFGDNNTQNTFSGLFENSSIQNDQKQQVIKQIEDMQKETDPVKKETKLKKFMKDWGPTLGETIIKTIKALTK